MIGLGTNLLPHVADPSMPSDHLTFVWAVAASLMRHADTRRIGSMLALVGVPMAWARIYLGVHFPLDMAGAALVASGSAWFAARSGRWFEEAVAARGDGDLPAGVRAAHSTRLGVAMIRTMSYARTWR